MIGLANGFSVLHGGRGLVPRPARGELLVAV